MADSGILQWAAFAAVSSFVLLVYFLLSRSGRLDVRLQELAMKPGSGPNPQGMTQRALSTLPKMGVALVPKNKEERTELQTRLLHAGLYSRQAMAIFLGVKMVLTAGPALLGLAMGLSGLVPAAHGVIFGALLGIFGMIGPSFWLDKRKAARQTALRRALPDAMDVLVICLEGGLSLPAGLRRLASELQTAHPQLASEMNIVQREIQLGRTPGEALRRFADRCDLEEIRTLAVVIAQAERYGASLIKALRVHAETLRGKRLQYAEEMAQKAAIKILFPTLLFIFPGIFIVILGPAAIQLAAMLSNVQR